jgi:SpoVK/Ycf46/Vps4 family AAA+-type ATPase
VLKTSASNLKERAKFATPVEGPAHSSGASAAELNLRYLQAELARIDGLIQAAVMAWQQTGRDPSDAFRGLVIGEAEVAQLLSQPFGGAQGDSAGQVADEASWALAAAESQQIAALAARQGIVLRLEQMSRAFGLTPFEMDAFLVCLAAAVDLRYEQIYSYLQNDINRKRPAVDLVLRVLVAGGVDRLRHLGCFAPDAPLLRHGLLVYSLDGGSVPPSLLAQPLHVERTVVNWLLGDYHPHTTLGAHAVLEQEEASSSAADLLGPELSAVLAHAANLPTPLLLFYGPDETAQGVAARLVARRLRRPLLRVDLAPLLAQASAAQVVEQALRDARLTGAVLYFQGWDGCIHEQTTPAHLVDALLAHPDIVLVSSRALWQPQGVARSRPVAPVEFALPDYGRRQALWRHYLAVYNISSPALNPVEVAGQFTLTTGQIRDAAAAARDQALHQRRPVAQEDLFAGARNQSTRLGEMARKITPRYDWEDIILPDDQIQILRELVATVRGRSRVLEEWGLGRKLASSAAVTVLFAGPPGTGKTMAAEVIAGDLGFDLYKIDLSSLVSKYIGETEKNLERVFTEAQSSNAILFFDEADAIFGKRSGVKDAHDRYANLEISYLLQRMEVYDGVTILATNLRSNLDEAFMRRLQFAVDIPFPDEKHRLRIWETLFPATVPRASDVNLEEMARRFKLAGGNIRNILLSAAYLAAADGGAITMQHLLHGTRREFQKMGRLVMDGRMQTGAEAER